jgi:hypothetical protein
MKNYTVTLSFMLVALSVGVIHSCKKESMPTPSTPYTGSPIAQSFTEEFKDFTTLVSNSGWITDNNTGDTLGNSYDLWSQGQTGTDKSGNASGLLAYSSSKSPDEYAYSAPDYYFPMSSWLITPLLSVKNGDKISFYTSTSPDGYTSNRMQVLMSLSGGFDVGDSVNAVGSFTTVLLDINPTEGGGLYPVTWKKYEYTFTTLQEKTDIRIGFRHYETIPMKAGSIGIDQFKFSVN